jgi:hypothetical protein
MNWTTEKENKIVLIASIILTVILVLVGNMINH